MSEENKNIDQLFSDAAQAEKAPQYDKAYWNEMNTMLNARDAKKKAFLLWAFGGSAAFTVLLFSLFAINMDNPSTEQRYAKEEINLKIENSNDQKNLNSPNETELAEQISLNQVDKNENLLVNSTEHQPNSNKENLVNTNSTVNKERKANSINEIETAEMYSATDEAHYLNSKSDENISFRNESVIKENEDLTEKIDSKELAKLNFSLPFKESNQLAQKSTRNIIPSTLKVKSPVQYLLYTKLNAGLMENYKTSRPFESGLFDLSLNLEINMNNVLLRTGLGAQMTSNADLIVSQRKTINGTMVVQLQKDLAYQNLFDVYIPLELGYQLNNTSFGVGAQVNYLMTTSMDLNNYENKLLVDTERQYGNKDGLNSFSTQGYIWIEQKFTPMLSLGLKTGTNISGRIKDGAYFNESSTTNPIYGQLSVRINLTK